MPPNIKFLLIFGLLTLLILSSPLKILAVCVDPGALGGRPSCRLTGHPVSCWIGPPQELVQCCDDISECPTDNQITPVPPNIISEEIYCSGDRVNTALGCLEVADVGLFVTQILNWTTSLISIGALAFLAYGGIMIMSSSGDPKRIKAGQEIIVSAIGALVLVVLSVVLLNFIGVNILNLSGLGFSF